MELKSYDDCSYGHKYSGVVSNFMQCLPENAFLNNMHHILYQLNFAVHNYKLDYCTPSKAESISLYHHL